MFRRSRGLRGFLLRPAGDDRRKTIDDALGQQIRAYVLGWLQTHPLTAFDDYSDTAYRRTYLGRCPATGWEAIVMSWKNGNRTSIHAHPQFAGYHIADGTFRLEIFEPAAGGAARLTESAVVEGPCAFFAVGAPGRFDNHIHRITCLSDTGHSLHGLLRRRPAGRGLPGGIAPRRKNPPPR